MTSKGTHRATTIDAGEVGRFDALAETWWDPDGPMKPLHGMNPVRLSFIREQAISHFGLDRRAIQPLAGLRVADVGCGAGLLSEPLARMGGEVTGIDPSERNIAVAQRHAAAAELDIRYLSSSLETVVASGERFDLITALEVVEHVADVPAFTAAVAEALKPGGLAILSTLNRSLRSYAVAIIGAEHLLRWLPVGTHDWRKFLRPAELEGALSAAGLAVLDTQGMVPAPFSGGWRLSQDTAVNYIVAAGKPKQASLDTRRRRSRAATNT
jgi:2-polyprenyl-6-hydroxyphenyl methylase / 3-demethylubiquinone-9 3-methyltransferase